MVDETAALFTGVDAARLMPEPIRKRLQEAIVANTLAPDPENFPWILRRSKRMPEELRARLSASLVEDGDVATVMAGIDEPRAIPIPIAQRLERSLPRSRSSRRIAQVFGVAAAAVLVVAGAVLVAVLQSGRTSGPLKPQDAAPVISTTPAPTATGALPSARASVLATKTVRPVVAPAADTSSVSNSNPDTQTLALQEPAPVSHSTDGVAFGSFARASAINSPANSGSILDGVTGLLSQLLSGLGVGGHGSIHGLPVDDASMLTPVAPAAVAAAPAAPVAPISKPTQPTPVAPRSSRHHISETRVVVVSVPVQQAPVVAPKAPALISVEVAGISISL